MHYPLLISDYSQAKVVHTELLIILSSWTMSVECGFNGLLLYWNWNQGCAESLSTCLVGTQGSWSSVDREIWMIEEVVLKARVDQ